MLSAYVGTQRQRPITLVASLTRSTGIRCLDVLSKSNRAYLHEMGALVTDADGREYLVGLTVEETAYFVAFSQAPVQGDFPSWRETILYLSLRRKHEEASLTIKSKKLPAERPVAAEVLTVTSRRGGPCPALPSRGERQCKVLARFVQFRLASVFR